MTALAGTNIRPPVAADQRSLRSDLLRLGFALIDPNRVASHIAADNRECRPTPGLRLIGLTFLVLQWCALGPVLKLFAPRTNILLRWGCAFALAVLLGIASILWSAFVTTTLWSTAASVPIIAWMLLISMFAVWATVLEEDPTLGDAVTFWERHHPHSVWDTLPRSVRALVQDLETELPDARLRVRSRDSDPFLEVARDGERHIVAAWLTGDETLDFVPAVPLRS